MKSSVLAKLNIFKRWRIFKRSSPGRDNHPGVFRAKYEHFTELLDSNAELATIIADIEGKLAGRRIFGMSYVCSQSARAVFHALRMSRSLNALSGNRYPQLFTVLDQINSRIREDTGRKKEIPTTRWILPYPSIRKDMVDWVGGKSANLGEVLNKVGLPIPEGFAITTQAFEYFLVVNDLVDEISIRKMELDPDDPDSIGRVSAEIRGLILAAPVPPHLGEAILVAYDEMMARIEPKTAGQYSMQVALRSSAVGEDSELSYAGQYLSLLNVPRERLCRSYQQIIASLYTPHAIAYRLSKGIRDEDTAMSVACLEMIDAVSSGVAYSHHPFQPLEDQVIINAVWGLGPYAVDGVVTPDVYTVAKDNGGGILGVRVSQKPVQLVSSPAGGVVERPVSEDLQTRPCLTPEQIQRVADWAVKLETHQGCPQDVEWALDRNGRLVILQSRPLRIEAPSTGGGEHATPVLAGYPLLVEDGAVACPGVGFGPAYLVGADDDLSAFPDGAVLVSMHASPKYALVMPKAQAIVIDSGSITGHMASLAREFGVPTLVAARVATSVIEAGLEISVDAYSGRVYRGRAVELTSQQRDREYFMTGTPVLDALKLVGRSIVPLSLLDPSAPTFTPENCKSVHDVMRYVHELSYVEMFMIGDLLSKGGVRGVRLDAPIPLDLYVIDLGGGLAGNAGGRRRITPAQVLSVPFKALLEGMTHHDLRYNQPRPVDLQGFLAVVGEQMLASPHGPEALGDRSYAAISDKYLNFSSRVGYHFGVLDCYCGQTTSENYITFSFRGGAADEVRRSRRARAIKIVLAALGFTVDVQGDRVDGRFQRHEAAVIEEKLGHIGRLLLFTRQMDMLMHGESSVETMARCFLEGDYRMEAMR